MRKLEFDAVCTSGSQRNGQNLFKISQIQNSRLRQKLISEAKNTENDGYGSIEDKWNNKNNGWSEERQWGDEENERDIEEEDNDGFNGRNEKNVDDNFRRRNRPSRDVRNKINFYEDRAGKAWEAPGGYFLARRHSSIPPPVSE
ncbi:unnamed protein product [Meloidogyne enterolobii]|uniref:Uncharacterized protein n=1 Tax=Meloidogyne enterolobii TaxID=390850 RepID=A0ACB0YV27_MELEN